ncbi:S24 family peptidase [Fertoebacter nigrum]|uniref:S24 family peptidase n=1 Tax=Fertoeibacter niger TaxID=2656921 RepID=A0A8X8KNI5_9RHOB|nr:S24 family peptidase [Fertoeibacter niger]NUB45035.1 S24 family peptidase [Fertoeibacter niger]
MDPILSIIDEALAKKSLSDAAASKLAVGNYALIKNMRSARSDDKRYSFQALERLADVLGLECYFGPPRETGTVSTMDLDGAEFANIPLYDATLAAGSGANNAAEAVISHLAFRRDWLTRIGVSASNSVLARAQGDSMNPCIHDGDLVLIDRSKTEAPVRARSEHSRRPPPIYALLQDGQARIKRIERPEPGLVMLMSDNPAFSPEVLTGSKIESLNIIGRVMWWGHTTRD